MESESLISVLLKMLKSSTEGGEIDVLQKIRGQQQIER